MSSDAIWIHRCSFTFPAWLRCFERFFLINEDQSSKKGSLEHKRKKEMEGKEAGQLGIAWYSTRYSSPLWSAIVSCHTVIFPDQWTSSSESLALCIAAQHLMHLSQRYAISERVYMDHWKQKRYLDLHLSWYQRSSDTNSRKKQKDAAGSWTQVLAST